MKFRERREGGREDGREKGRAKGRDGERQGVRKVWKEGGTHRAHKRVVAARHERVDRHPHRMRYLVRLRLQRCGGVGGSEW